MINELIGMYMKLLNIGSEFSEVPSGRFRSDGKSSGETFREDLLRKKLESLESGEKLRIILDDKVEGYGSSFLVEGFAGIVKYGYMQNKELLSKIELICTNPDFVFYKNKIEQYIREAQFGSQRYVPTKRV